MKKLIYLFTMAAMLGLATSCEDKKDKPNEDEIDDITIVVSEPVNC